MAWTTLPMLSKLFEMVLLEISGDAVYYVVLCVLFWLLYFSVI